MKQLRFSLSSVLLKLLYRAIEPWCVKYCAKRSGLNCRSYLQLWCYFCQWEDGLAETHSQLTPKFWYNILHTTARQCGIIILEKNNIR